MRSNILWTCTGVQWR